MSSARVLVLEDNAQMRMLLYAVLNGLGFSRVHFASTLEEAKQMFLDLPVDLVLTDQMLQTGMGGLDFVRWIRSSADKERAMLPIIAISSMADRKSVMTAINAGIDEFLVKPLSPAGLAARITMVIRKRRPFVRTKDYFGPCRRRQSERMYFGPKRRKDDFLDPAQDDDVFMVA